MPRSPGAGSAEFPQHALQRPLEIGRHLVNQADAKRGGGVEALTRDEIPPCRALADLPERVRGDHSGDDPELDLGEGEHRPLLGKCDVGCRDEPCSSAERMPLDEDDHGRGARVHRIEHPAKCVRIGDVLVERERRRRTHPLDVGTRTEARAVAREHDRPGLADVHERLRELGDQSGIERVAGLGPAERDPQHVVVPLDPQRVHVCAV